MVGGVDSSLSYEEDIGQSSGDPTNTGLIVEDKRVDEDTEEELEEEEEYQDIEKLRMGLDAVLLVGQDGNWEDKELQAAIQQWPQVKSLELKSQILEKGIYYINQ